METSGSWFDYFSGPETYRWCHNGALLVDGRWAIGAVSGATTRMVWISRVTSVAQGQIHVEVSTPCGSVASVPDTITILYPGDVTAGAIAGMRGDGTPNGVVNSDGFFY